MSYSLLTQTAHGKRRATAGWNRASRRHRGSHRARPPLSYDAGTERTSAARDDDRHQLRCHRRCRIRAPGRTRRRPGRPPVDLRRIARRCAPIATGLLRAGIETGDRVGIWAPNRWEWVLVQYATAEIGAILVTINPAYQTRELEYALRQSEVAMVIAAPSFKTTDYATMLAEVAPRCPGPARRGADGKRSLGRADRRRTPT